MCIYKLYMRVYLCMCMRVCLNPPNKKTCFELDPYHSRSPFLPLQRHKVPKAWALWGKDSKAPSGSTWMRVLRVTGDVC